MGCVRAASVGKTDAWPGTDESARGARAHTSSSEVTPSALKLKSEVRLATSKDWSTPYRAALPASHTSSYEWAVTGTSSSVDMALRTLFAKRTLSAISTSVGQYSGRYVTSRVL